MTIGSVVCVAPEFQRTSEPPDGSEVKIKLLPLTVRVKEALPAAAVVGEREVTAGTGFAGGLMVNEMTLERPFCPAPEKGFSVLTKAVPGLAIMAVVIAAVTVEALTYVVA